MTGAPTADREPATREHLAHLDRAVGNERPPSPRARSPHTPPAPPRYPAVVVTLTGYDGNALESLGQVTQALHCGGATCDEVQAFQNEATPGDYDALLETFARWVTRA